MTNPTGTVPYEVRKGTTRHVLAVGDIAIKLAINDRGINCNRREAETWRAVSEKNKHVLCPVLWISPCGTALTLKRVQMLTEEEFSAQLNANAVPEWDTHCGDGDDPTECKASNWGWLDGRMLAVDYALPSFHDCEN